MMNEDTRTAQTLSAAVSTMTERRPQKKKSLKERAEALAQGVMDAIGSLMPSPQLIPIPVRPRQRPYARR